MGRSVRVVISLGGSLIVPDAIDTDFLKAFQALIQQYVAKGISFVIVAGGGAPARRYQEAVKEIQSNVSQESLDWVGIEATRMNAQFVRHIFGEAADSTIVTDPTVLVETAKPLIVAGGWKPGWSTDYVAVELARTYGAQRVVNLTNITHVYSGDPKTDKQAKAYEHVSWSEYRRIIPDTWQPGLNTPFDPIASAKAEALGLEVAIIAGKDLESVEQYLLGESFTGTRILPVQ